VFYNNFITKKLLYSFGNQNFFNFPAKNALGRTDRDNHGDRYTHLTSLGIIKTTE